MHLSKQPCLVPTDRLTGMPLTRTCERLRGDWDLLPARPFTDRMRITCDWSSDKDFALVSIATGHSYRMFKNDFIDMLQKVVVQNGVVEATWMIKGTRNCSLYSIVLAELA